MKGTTISFFILSIVLATAVTGFGARVITDGDTIYIEDRTGERWDVSQAKKLGFQPHKFQYGLGKDAFLPLQDDDFDNSRISNLSNTRIIGVSIDGNAHAYAVNRLSRHEIANTTLAGKAITAGY
ncbi:MAG: hypothetical protein ACN4GW_10150 [Desulforhopalus sp.]